MKRIDMNRAASSRRALLIAGVTGSTLLLSGCFPLVAGGVAGGALSLADRRTTGAQADDQAIELKAFNRFRERFKSDKVSLSVTSFNRIALLTGFVPDAATRSEAAAILGRIENVRTVVNEVTVGPKPSITAYAKDTWITTRVKASLIDTKDLHANAIKVYTEASVVFLMGVVTEREASRSADVAARVPGVTRVVRAFEIISEAELSRMTSQGQADAPASQPDKPASRPEGAVVTPIR
jgi:osmotically-inducible protein OsmY